MSGSSAEEEHVRTARVDVDQEVPVRAVLILADLGASQLRAPEQGEAAIPIGHDLGQGRFRWPAALCVRIDLHAVLIMRKLEAARLEVGEPVEDVAPVE